MSKYNVKDYLSPKEMKIKDRKCQHKGIRVIKTQN